jgi:hypothetical protein
MMEDDSQTQPGASPRRPTAHDETIVAPQDARPAPGGRDLAGTTLGDYRLDRKLAEGGMGEVYEATQLKLDRKVALKILSRRLAERPEFLQRFEREAKSAAALNHPHIVQVHDFGQAGGHFYLIMELVEGEDMADYLVKRGKLPAAEALDVIEQAAQALKAAREKAIIHRDIKPANLLRTKEGRIKVSDLGLAKKLTEDSDMTATGVGIGSPHFLAPEQADDARRVDHRADIYSLGITLLYLLTGKKPYDGTSAFSVVMAHASRPLPSGAELGTELPENVEGLIRRMAAKKPEERYQDYGSLLADIARVKAGYAPIQWLPRSLRWPGAGWKIAAAIGLLGFIAWGIVYSKRPAGTVADNTDLPAGSPAASTQPAVAPGPRVEPPAPPFEGGKTKGGPPGMRPPLPMMAPPNFNPVPDGPPEQMLAAADALARAGTNQYVVIINAYMQVEEKVRGTPLEREVALRHQNTVLAHEFEASEAIQKYRGLMQKHLDAGQVQEAYNVWKDFPQRLRSREVDQQVMQIFQAAMPRDFRPQ